VPSTLYESNTSLRCDAGVHTHVAAVRGVCERNLSMLQRAGRMMTWTMTWTHASTQPLAKNATKFRFDTNGREVKGVRGGRFKLFPAALHGVVSGSLFLICRMPLLDSTRNVQMDVRCRSYIATTCGRYECEAQLLSISHHKTRLFFKHKSKTSAPHSFKLREPPASLAAAPKAPCPT
jgi:hypothetical protein